MWSPIKGLSLWTTHGLTSVIFQRSASQGTPNIPFHWFQLLGSSPPGTEEKERRPGGRSSIKSYKPSILGVRLSPSHGIFSCKRFRLSDHLLMETFISQEKDSEGDVRQALES